jgi:hypothetical protein
MRTAPLLLALALALAGCMNYSTTLVGAGKNPLPDLAPVEIGTTPQEAPTDAPPAAPAPSILTLSRAHWPVVFIYQPRGQVRTSIFGGPEPEWAVERVPEANPPAEPIRFR